MASRRGWSSTASDHVRQTMGHKILQDHAYTFCQMFMGWRMADDLDVFANLPDGILTIDVLCGTCSHDELGSIETRIAPEIAAWFLHRLDEHRIPRSDIIDATLTVSMDRRIPLPTLKRDITYDWTCDGSFRTKDREYHARLSEPHTWLPSV